MDGRIVSDLDVPWCRELLASPDIIDKSTPTRKPPPPADKLLPNLLFSETWRTSNTIRAWKSLQTRDIAEPNLSPEHILLLSLGTGLGGWVDTLHGGAAAAILDQTIAMTPTRAIGPVWTKELSVKKSLKLPSVVVCRSALTSREGRAIWITATMADGEGTVYSEAKALCIVAARGDKKEAKI